MAIPIPARMTALALATVALTGCAYFEVSDDAHDDDHADSSSVPLADAPEVEVTARAMEFEPQELELAAREPVNVVLTSADVLHDLVVDEADFHLAAEDGETVTGGLVLDEPGTYLAYCSVPGHRDAGMELELTVR